MIVPAAAAKDGSQAVVEDLMSKEWADIKVTLANPAGKTAGFYVKAMLFEPDLSKFSLFFTSVARAVATYNALGATGSADFEEYLNANFPSSTAADYAIFELGLVDADTYVEQGLMWKEAHFAYFDYIIRVLGVKPDLLLLGNPVTDEFSHMFLGLTTPMVNGIANPYYNNYYSYGRLITPEIAEGFLKEAYAEADQTLALARMWMRSATVVASSDHGFGAQWLAVNAGKVLCDAALAKERAMAPRYSATAALALARAPSTWQKLAGLAAPPRSMSIQPFQQGRPTQQVRTAVVQCLHEPDRPG